MKKDEDFELLIVFQMKRNKLFPSQRAWKFLLLADVISSSILTHVQSYYEINHHIYKQYIGVSIILSNKAAPTNWYN